MEIMIEAKNLRKSYGSLTAVDGVSIQVGRGEAFGLLGANGAGKTTTLECILGTVKPDSGQVSILGRDPCAGRNRKELFQRVGVQFQEGSFQEKITAGELCQITAALYRDPERPAALLDQFGIADKAKSPVKDLSGGQRQRLFLVLALIPSPQAVFLDELTTGLDPRARRDVWDILSRRKAEGLTLFLTSHFMDEVEVLCDHICILRQGKAVFTGTVSQAIAESPCDRFEDAYLWYTKEEDTRHESLSNPV